MTLADLQSTFYYSTVGGLVFCWSTAAIRISIILMLLRFEQRVPWRRFLWALMVFQILLGFSNMLAQILRCTPLRIAWDILRIIPKRCWSSEADQINSIIVSASTVLTDWICALLPISFLRKINIPFRERIFIGILMGLGVFAGAASIVRSVVTSHFNRTNDPLTELIRIATWLCVEQLVGIIAACVPCLRGPFQRLLERLGLVSPYEDRNYPQNRDKNRYPRAKKSGKSLSLTATESAALRMNNLRGAKMYSEEHILTAEAEETEAEARLERAILANHTPRLEVV